MPGGRTKFQEKWLESMDANNEAISNWCAKGKNQWEVVCKYCNCSVSTANGGISQLLQHSARSKHISAAKKRKGQTTLRCSQNKTDEAAVFSNITHGPLSVNKHVTSAEALWAMKVAASNYSFASCTDIVSLFKKMFYDNPIAEKMCLSDTKISYVLSYGLGPFFHEEIVSDLHTAIASGSYFTLAFDETTTVQIKKQLDILIRFWSPKFDRIICGYLTSLFLGHATAEVISNGIQTILEANKLPIDKVLMLSMDGPNVNLSIAKKLNKELLNLGSPELFDLGTCSLHKVHNCFSKALDIIPLDIDELATDLFAFFKISAARREDLKNMEKLLEYEPKFLLRHVNSRWLTLGPVTDRIICLYSVLQEYFIQALPKAKNTWGSLQKNARYKRIASTLKDPLTVVYLQFISAIYPTLQEYLSLFQNEGPLVHLMYGKMNFLVRSIMLRFLKETVVGNSEGKDLLSINIDDFENYRPLKDVNIGEGARRALMHLKENYAKEARRAIRSFLVKLCKLLKEALPLADVFLKDLEYLHPTMRNNIRENVIRRLCVQLKPLKLNIHNIDTIVQEWTIFKFDTDVDKLSADFVNSTTENKRIDEFWRNVFSIKEKISGKDKYTNLAILVKCCLSLSHGNSDVERGFSINNAMVTSNRACLSEATIIGIRHVKDAIKRYGNICDVPITDKLLNYVVKSHSAYASAKEAERKVEENIKKKRKLEEAEQNMLKEAKKLKKDTEEKIKENDAKIKNIQEDLSAAHKCLIEGNQRLQMALKMKDMGDMRISSTVIEAATLKIKESTEELNKANEEKFKLQSSLKI